VIAATIKPEKILRDLGELWTSLATGEGASTGVLRACAMTLVVAAESDADAQAVGETLAELMHEHPSRAIVLRLSQDESAELQARVFAQCWMPFGGRQQICCEEIEITTPAGHLSDVARVILGLIVPDLPVVLWCRGARWFDSAEFRHLFALADKLILDSTHFGDARPALALLRSLSREGRIGDLAWARLTGWRELVAQIFEDPANRESLKGASVVSITYGGIRAPVMAFYIAAWLRLRLPDASLEFNAVPGHEPHLRQIALQSDGLEARITAEGATVDVTVGTQVDRAIFPPNTDYSLMREELSILGADPIYQAVLPLAQQLADAS